MNCVVDAFLRRESCTVLICTSQNSTNRRVMEIGEFEVKIIVQVNDIVRVFGLHNTAPKV